MSLLRVGTAVGEAHVDLRPVPDAPAVLVLGHGAGGSIDSSDLVAVRDSCLAAGSSVARVLQPYRVAGRKAPPAAATLDTAWRAVLTSLARRKALSGQRFVFGGRSSGARVACRTAADQAARPAAAAVLALAFPVHPPGRPEQSRLAELDAVPVPVLVVQGSSDPFGMPPPAAGRQLVEMPGDHSLKRGADQIGAVVADWLTRTVR